MARSGRPFIFCRYAITKGDESLTGVAQLAMLQELQGKMINHRAVNGERPLDSFVMRPKRYEIEGVSYLTWSVGQYIDIRQRADYDPETDRLTHNIVKDGSVKYTDMVAIPTLGVLAADDRSGTIHLGGKAVVNRFRSIVRSQNEFDFSVIFSATTTEVNRALRDWSLTKFRFTVQPNNPRPVSKLGAKLGAQMKADGIGVFSGVVTPQENKKIHVTDDGLIQPTVDLIQAGYGQMALAGEMPTGQYAEIKKPTFNKDVDKNEKLQQKARELRVYVNDEVEEEKIFEETAKSMIRFYGDE